jgi:hypothetical protein
LGKIGEPLSVDGGKKSKWTLLRCSTCKLILKAIPLLEKRQRRERKRKEKERKKTGYKHSNRRLSYKKVIAKRKEKEKKEKANRVQAQQQTIKIQKSNCKE